MRRAPAAVVAAAVLAAAGCGREAGEAPAPVSIPQGTTLSVVLDQTLTTRIHRAGDPFVATLSETVLVDGRVAIAAGASLHGRVKEAVSGAREGTPRLTLAFTRAVGTDGVATAIEVRPLRMEGAAPDAESAAVRSPFLGDEIDGQAAPVAVAVSDANEIELPIGQRLLLEVGAASPVVAAAVAGAGGS